MTEFLEWSIHVDAYDAFNVAQGVSDDWDIREVISASSHLNVITSHKQLTVQQVLAHQTFVNRCSEFETTSSHWAYLKLQASTDSVLLTRVKQRYNDLPAHQQGGVILLKYILDEIDKDSFEGRQALVKWIENFDIRNFEGQDIRLATTHFRAIYKLLGSHAQDDAIRQYLRGMSHASHDEFAATCKSSIGFIDSPAYKYWAKDMPSDLAILDEFSSTLVDKFSKSEVSLAWTGASHKASAFRASFEQSSSQDKPSSNQGNKEKTWEEWWDSSICQIKGCGGAHPTRYHNNLEARYRRNNRPNNSRRLKHQESRGFNARSAPKSNSKSEQRLPKFKSDNARNKFKKQIYAAAQEAIEEDDLELFANFAGDSDDESDAFVDADDGVDEGSASIDPQEVVNAAISLDMLLNY